ncbi:unnamed protein product [Vitrella brassicaformis CCMP3155]|uniref:Uncharacterized protein n=1 Tax=Vitrella brassicaformis (strain CCMP3155) TaxID=1169540 RepID=A0A0G4EDM7_VITBC|nr:unnamed protein product [Vitrella brassicaformis CCMP3155]|eukprot:CEL93825.1 unnamed protein product [Vitrella brassicaformis CCMP3155]
MMAQRECRRASERRQGQESVLRQGESRARLEEQRRQVAHQLQLQRGGRQGRAELPLPMATRETADCGPRYVPDETVDTAQVELLNGPIALRLPVSVNRDTKLQDTDRLAVLTQQQMTREPQQYGSRYVCTGQDDAYGGVQHSATPIRWAASPVLAAPDQPRSFVRKRPVVSRGIQCSIMTTQTPLGPQRTRGVSRHHHHHQQVEAMASLVGRHPPPPDSHDTYNRQSNGSDGLFGGMFLGLGSLLSGGRASGAVREETRELPLNRRTNRGHIHDGRYAYGAQGGSYESRYYQQEPVIDRQQAIEAYARELDNWKGFWEMELQERSEIQERLRRQHEERAAEREKRMERFHRQ